MRFSLIIFLIFISLNSAKASTDFKELPPAAIEALLKKYDIPKEHLSFHIKEVNGSQTQSFQAEVAFIPASTAKIISLVQIMSEMKEDHTFKTVLKYSGTIKDQVITGDLFLIGGGDPFLTYGAMSNLVLSLRSKNINKVKGNLYFIDSYFTPKEKISDIGHGDQTYNPGLSPLSLEFNQIKAYQTSKHHFDLIPDIKHFKISRTNDEFAARKSFRYKQNPSREQWEVSTKKPYRTLERIPIRSPSLITASVFKSLLNKWGIKVEGTIKNVAEEPNNLKGVSKVSSRPLRDLSQAMMEFSNNLFAETLLLNWFVNNHPKQNPTLSNAVSEMMKQLRQKNKEIDLSQWKIVNASGLSSDSRVTTKAFTELLEKWNQLSFGETYLPHYLSISGHSGFLATRLDSPEFAMKVWAKTGSLDYVINSAGYFFSNSGKQYAYTLFFNDQKSRGHLDRNDGSEIYKRARIGLRGWRDKVMPLSDEILKHWIKTL